MKKEKILIVVCVILAVISIGLGGFIIYDKVNYSKTRGESDNSLMNNNDHDTDIQQDLEKSENNITIDDDSEKFTAYLDNGVLYYQINDGPTKKYDALTNIKKCVAHSYGTSMRYELFLITESGKVYSTIEFFEDELVFKETEIFKNYEVEDILSKTGEVKEEFKVLLKNGKTISVTRLMA